MELFFSIYLNFKYLFYKINQESQGHGTLGANIGVRLSGRVQKDQESFCIKFLIANKSPHPFLFLFMPFWIKSNGQIIFEWVIIQGWREGVLVHLKRCDAWNMAHIQGWWESFCYLITFYLIRPSKGHDSWTFRSDYVPCGIWEIIWFLKGCMIWLLAHDKPPIWLINY